MSKKVSWIVAMLLCTFMVLAVTGCASNNNSSTAPNSSKSTAEQNYIAQLTPILGSESSATSSLQSLEANASEANVDPNWYTQVNINCNTISNNLSTLQSLNVPVEYQQSWNLCEQAFSLQNQACNDLRQAFSTGNGQYLTVMKQCQDQSTTVMQQALNAMQTEMQ